MTATFATYTKLRDGSWGIKTTAATVRPGAQFVVRKQSGETKTETVGKVVWSGDGVTICSIASSSAQRKPTSSISRPGRRYECEECGERHTPNDGTRCWETGAPH